MVEIKEEIVIKATFSSHEDLSSRLVLLPYNDDDCTGAKICSHKMSDDELHLITPTTIDNDEKQESHEEDKAKMSDDDKEATVDMDLAKSRVAESKLTANSDECHEAEASQYNGRSQASYVTPQINGEKPLELRKNEHDLSPSEQNSLLITTKTEQQVTNRNTEEISREHPENPAIANGDSASINIVTQRLVNTPADPIGYVLVKMEENNKTTVNDMELEEFAWLLSILREASYPILLSFAPSTVLSKVCESDGCDDYSDPSNGGCRFVDSAKSKSSSPQTASHDNSMDNDKNSASDMSDAQNGTTETENQTYLSALASREDAAKVAAQAATELRGRLSRWGLHAATRAAEAASAVKELKEERQRKLKEDKDEKGDGNTGNSDNIASSFIGNEEVPSPMKGNRTHGATVLPIAATESQHPIEKISIFLQTPSGFEKIPDSCPERTSVTNTSVISVRLSKTKACSAVDKKTNQGYEFQWYRSIHISDRDNPKDRWYKLSGATFAAYQPSVSDVGHRLCCQTILHYGKSPLKQTCILPFPVSVDSSLLNSAKETLLRGKQTTTFCSLLGMDDAKGRMFRLKIDVRQDSCGNVIESAIHIDQMSGGSVEPLHDRSEPLTSVNGYADPARPRSFHLSFSSGLPPSASMLAALTESSDGQLRLEAPNRAARESLLLAIGISNYRGDLSSLSNETILFPDHRISKADCLDSEVMLVHSFDTDLTVCSELPSPTVVLKDSFVSASKCPRSLSHKCSNDASDTEAEIEELRRILQIKETSISELKQKLATSRAETSKAERDLQSCRHSVRETSSELKRARDEIETKTKLLEEHVMARRDEEIEHQKLIKSLSNEKAVLSAAVEARDGKTVALTKKISILEKQIVSQSQQLSELDNLTNELVRYTSCCLA
mmetsp:Transcript_15649/g.32515  ORF Transcript_15649/g.32515 Transcript_15649/m.32515 type:complete len:901 (-) Transcript_15649:2104-4806(-)